MLSIVENSRQAPQVENVDGGECPYSNIVVRSLSFFSNSVIVVVPLCSHHHQSYYREGGRRPEKKFPEEFFLSFLFLLQFISWLGEKKAPGTTWVDTKSEKDMFSIVTELHKKLCLHFILLRMFKQEDVTRSTLLQDAADNQEEPK